MHVFSVLSMFIVSRSQMKLISEWLMLTYFLVLFYLKSYNSFKSTHLLLTVCSVLLYCVNIYWKRGKKTTSCWNSNHVTWTCEVCVQCVVLYCIVLCIQLKMSLIHWLMFQSNKTCICACFFLSQQVLCFCRHCIFFNSRNNNKKNPI